MDHLDVRAALDRWPLWLASLRRHVVRHRTPRLVIAGLLGLAALVVLHHELERTRMARRRWGDETTVLVARRDVAAGVMLTDDDVEVRSLPAPVVPTGALTELAPGLRAIDRLRPGEVVLSHHTTAGSGVAALLPPGTQGVAIARSGLPWTPEVGDAVGLVAIDDPLGAGTATVPPAVFPGVVIAVDDSAVLMAIDETIATPASRLAAMGQATLLLLSAPATGPQASG